MWTSYSKLFTCVCVCVCMCVCMCVNVCVCTIDVLHHMLRRSSRCSCVMPPTAQSTCKCISPTHNDITGHVHIHIQYIHTHTGSTCIACFEKLCGDDELARIHICCHILLCV